MGRKAFLFGLGANVGGSGFQFGQDIVNKKTDADTIIGDTVSFVGNMGLDVAVDDYARPIAGKLINNIRNSGANVIRTLSNKLAQRAASTVSSRLSSRLAASTAKVLSSLGSKIGTSAARNLAIGAASGPIGMAVSIALTVLQLAFTLIDALWDPWKNYFNKDLAELKDTLDESLKNTFIELGANWPVEIKPAILTTDSDMDKLKSLVQQYYQDNGLISKDEAIAEDQIQIGLQEVRRVRKMFTFDSNQNVTISVPQLQIIDSTSETQQNIALLLATAASLKKGYGTDEYKSKRTETLLEYQRPWYRFILTYIKSQWTFLLFIITCIILSSLSMYFFV